jgi:hypothetical protein
MDAHLVHQLLGVDQDVDEVRDGRALVAADISDAGLQQRLGDGQDALAMEHLAVAQAQQLDLFPEGPFGAHPLLPPRGRPSVAAR